MSAGNRRRRKEDGRLPPPLKCKAHSSQTGKPCQNPPLRGMVVCRMHGGAAPQVMKAAKERAQLATDELVGRLVEIGMLSEDERAAIAASREVNEIAGLKKVAGEVPKRDSFLGKVIRKSGKVDRSSRYDRRTDPLDDEDDD